MNSKNFFKCLFGGVLVALAFLLSFTAFAQDSTVVATTATAPWQSAEFMQGLILILTPMIIWLIDKIPWAKVPSWSYPMLALLFGWLINAVESWAGAQSTTWYYALIIGLAGVGLRELYSQIMKRKNGVTAKACDNTAATGA